MKKQGTGIRDQRSAKYTPGPWKVTGPAGAGIMVGTEPAQRQAWIAVVYGPNVTPEAAGNAALIAAAPEIYEALKLARQCVAYCRRAHKDIQYGDGIPVEAFIDAALKKAEAV